VSEALDAEQALLGCVLLDNDAFRLAEGVRPDHLSFDLHARLWDGVERAVLRGELAEPVMLSEQLREDPSFKEAGGIRYLAELVDKAPPPARAPHYAGLIRDAFFRRTLQGLAAEIGQAARDPERSAFDCIAEAERSVNALLNDAAPASHNLIDHSASVTATLEEIEAEARQGRAKGAMTGLRCFDMRMRGLRPGWLVVVAGRPSMGKTALARAAAFGCARKNPDKQVVFFALEMARRELDERSLSQLSYEAGDGIAYKDMNGDTLSPEDRGRLRQLAWKTPKNLLIDDSPILSVSYVRRRVLALKRKGPVAAVFIDYLQIMDRPDAKGRNEASVIGEMTKGLKQLAREAGTCVVLLSQINRGVESRDDKRPQLSDLRESGAIEQDANAVFFPFREVYYKERAEPAANATAEKRQAWELEVEEYRRRMDVICAKVRQGAVGTDTQIYFAEYDAVHDRPEDREAYDRRRG
jgi:replicative DNA helicase